jgi:hypothetical protein
MVGSGPQTKQDVLHELVNLQGQLNLWLEIAAPRFASPIGEAWSAADTIRHLIKSTVPVTRALKLPRLALQIIFGQSHRTSISYCDLIERYRAVLVGGDKAGRFSPSPCRVPADVAAWQRDLIYECQSGSPPSPAHWNIGPRWT